MIYLTNKKQIVQFLVSAAVLVLVFGGGFFIGKSQTVCQICTPDNIDFSLFWEAYNKLGKNFIGPEKINDEKVVYQAIAGLAKSLGDPYTEFFDPTQAKAFQQDLSGSFDGIGVEIGIKKDQLTVIAPLRGTPGERAGLKSGDQIIKIDGKTTLDMSVYQAVNLIRGKKGTQVVLTIFREGWSQTQDITIVRDKIQIDSLKWELKNNDIAYIHIVQFGQTLPAEFRKAAFEILQSPAKSIVLDLRDNPGGYLEVAQDIAGWFLERGRIVTIEDFGKDEAQIQFKAEGNAALVKYPIVVLMNKGSASASEILAGALRDNRNVTLIGEKSYGKGSVQELFTLRDGESFLKITTAKWLTPKGATIAEIGLAPDIKVEISEDDFKQGRDPQLDKAIEIVKQ